MYIYMSTNISMSMNYMNMKMTINYMNIMNYMKINMTRNYMNLAMSMNYMNIINYIKNSYLSVLTKINDCCWKTLLPSNIITHWTIYP